MTLEKATASAELDERVRARTQVECLIRDLEEAGEKGVGQKADLEAQLSDVEAKIKDKEIELMEVTPNWEDKCKEEKVAKERQVRLA